MRQKLDALRQIDAFFWEGTTTSMIYLAIFGHFWAQEPNLYCKISNLGFWSVSLLVKDRKAHSEVYNSIINIWIFFFWLVLVCGQVLSKWGGEGPAQFIWHIFTYCIIGQFGAGKGGEGDPCPNFLAYFHYLYFWSISSLKLTWVVTSCPKEQQSFLSDLILITDNACH